MPTRHALPLIVLLALPGLAAAQRPGRIDAAVDSAFEQFRGTDRPGCAIGVSREGRTVLERAYGMANLETGTPITPASIFHVASVSKQFTAAAVMLLAREGKLSLDDDIRTHLPEIPDYGTRITIRHLLTHTSGLRDQWELLGLARNRFEENRITEADVMDIVVRQRALNFTPGGEYLYSNTGYTLAAVIVKRVSGQSLKEFAHERIFVPLGMMHTHFHDDYTMLVPGRTSAYARRGDGWRVSIPNFDTYGATSLYTTVGDLLKWEANFDSLAVGDSALFAAMETPARLTNGAESDYGLGLIVTRRRGARVVGHGGADAGYRSYVGRYPEHALAIAIACNASTANPTAISERVADAYLGSALASVDADGSGSGSAIDEAALQRRAGLYVHPRTLNIVELSVRDGRLVGRGTPPLVPVSADRFRVGGSEITFLAGEKGGFELRLANGIVDTLERRERLTPRGAALAAYAGDYFSSDVNATYRVTVTDSSLTLVSGPTEPFDVQPLFADTFQGGGYVVQFVRRGSRIVGFEVTNRRMRRVAFSRVTPTR